MIFHSYVSLPEGIGVLHNSGQKIGCASLEDRQVCLSDLPDVTALLQFNVALNRARGLTLDVQAPKKSAPGKSLKQPGKCWV